MSGGRYFHENQLTYPVQRANRTSPPAHAVVAAERDFQFGWIQIMSALVADVVCFNSTFNREAFLSAIDVTMRRIPDPHQRVLGPTILSTCGRACRIRSNRMIDRDLPYGFARVRLHEWICVPRHCPGAAPEVSHPLLPAGVAHRTGGADDQRGPPRDSAGGWRWQRRWWWCRRRRPRRRRR